MKVICPYCQKELKQITSQHLKLHNKSIKDLKQEFPNCKILSDDSINNWYVKGTERIHRFNLRKRPDEPKDIPEYILRTKEGYSRIFDCGSLKFIKIRG